MSEKPSLLILGGCGFIGRHLLRYVVENNLVSRVRVVDKTPPMLSYMTEDDEKLYEHELVEFKQAKIGTPGHVERAFEGVQFTYVVNLAAETKFGQAEETYKQLVTDVALVAGTAAAKNGCERFLHVSTGQVYEPGKKEKKEHKKIKPWTNLAKAHYDAEEGLRAIPDLPLIILRPSYVYGPGDIRSISPRLICGAVYAQLGEKMKFLWSGDLLVNTVHVRDVSRAIFHLLVNAKPGSVYNITDNGCTDQQRISDIIASIFAVETGFYGSIMSNLARLNFSGVCEEANDKHMGPWQELIKEYKLNTPLSPFVDQELLYNNSLSLNGNLIKEEMNFELTCPEMNENLIREQIQYFIDIKAFPDIL